eukprot:s860_g23.t1
MHLLPLPSGAARSAPSSSVEDGTNSAKSRPKKRAKASAKAKSKCPDELKGYDQFDDKHQPICWAFNLSKGCSEETKDGRCKKGMHVCIRCKRNNHSLVTCRVKKG